MIRQNYVTHCGECGEEVESGVLDMTGKNEVIVDFIDGMEFVCHECGRNTYIEISKFTD